MNNIVRWSTAVVVFGAGAMMPAHAADVHVERRPGENEVVVVAASGVSQAGRVAEGEAPAGTFVIANEPGDGRASTVVKFDLSQVPYKKSPRARLVLKDVEKLKVKRPGAKAATERCVVHVYTLSADGAEARLVHTSPVRLGFKSDYLLDVTSGVNAVLSQDGANRKLRLDVRLEGKPIPFEIYGLPTGEGRSPPTLEVTSPDGWLDDWERRLEPITQGDVVYRESCLPLVETPGESLPLKLLYPAKRVLEVIRLSTGEKLAEGKDWKLEDGRVVLLSGPASPLLLANDFFANPRTEKDGTVRMIRGTTQLKEGTWYQERQIEVTYEPAQRDWTWPKQISTLDDLPRLKKLLTGDGPIEVILFGDSISYGGNASQVQGWRPFQPSYGDLVLRKLEQTYGKRFAYFNHSRGGATSGYALTQIDSQVGYFEPDLVILAYGMNDRGDGRREIYRDNLEKMIDAVRTRSPETEFLIVTPMLNNPKQPTGLDPVLFIRDEALKIKRPGIAHVDVTSTHLAINERKEYLDLSGNGANHPNDFLHRIYAQRVLEVLTPQETR